MHMLLSYPFALHYIARTRAYKHTHTHTHTHTVVEICEDHSRELRNVCKSYTHTREGGRGGFKTVFEVPTETKMRDGEGEKRG